MKRLSVVLALILALALIIGVFGCGGGKEYSLTIVVNGQGTTAPAAGTYKYEENTSVAVTATPATGYKFDNWSGDASGSNTTVAVTTTTDKTVTANFSKIQYTLTIAKVGNGTTDPTVGTHNYDLGTVVNIIATPDTDWQFYEWTGDASGTSLLTTVTMDSSKAVVANFDKPFTYSLNIGLGNGYYPLSLSVGDRVDFSFTVVGAQVWWNVKDPNSNIIINGSGGNKVMNGSATFVAATSGAYQLYFSSSGILTSSGVQITGTIYPAS